MIRLFFYLKKISKGIVLDEIDLKIVKMYLGYSFNVYIVVPLIVLIFLLAMIIFFLILELYLLSIILAFVALFVTIYFLPVFFFIYRKLYDKSLLKALNNLLSKYEGMNLVYTTYQIHSNYDISKNSVYFFYDEYYFYIVEDLLIREKIRKNTFKYIDSNSLNKRNISFKLSDVLSFVVNTNLEYKDNTLKEALNKEVETDSYCKIDLKNFKSIIVGYEVGLVLNKYIPYLNEYK